MSPQIGKGWAKRVDHASSQARGEVYYVLHHPYNGQNHLFDYPQRKKEGYQSGKHQSHSEQANVLEKCYDPSK